MKTLLSLPPSVYTNPYRSTHTSLFVILVTHIAHLASHLFKHSSFLNTYTLYFTTSLPLHQTILFHNSSFLSRHLNQSNYFLLHHINISTISLLFNFILRILLSTSTRLLQSIAFPCRLEPPIPIHRTVFYSNSSSNYSTLRFPASPHSPTKMLQSSHSS